MSRDGAHPPAITSSPVSNDPVLDGDAFGFEQMAHHINLLVGPARCTGDVLCGD